jgi:hypothetical protein
MQHIETTTHENLLGHTGIPPKNKFATVLLYKKTCSKCHKTGTLNESPRKENGLLVMPAAHF